MENKYRESNIDFIFPDDCQVIKFDSSQYYVDSFSRMPGGKGVDFIVNTKDHILLIEVKNCTGHEQENRHRTATAEIRRTSAATNAVFAAADNFDSEIPIKVAMSLSCLMGAHIKHSFSQKAFELEPYFQAISSEDICAQKKGIIVILVLEGDFENRTRSKEMIMQRIQNSIRGKLKWLACKKVYVVDTNTYNGRYFSMSAAPEVPPVK